MPARMLRLPGLTVRLEAADEGWLAELSSTLLAPFLTDHHSSADAILRVHEATSRVEVRGGGSFGVNSPELLACATEALLCRTFIDRSRHHLVLHAGAAVHQGQAVVLPGASQAGKSTLTLALLGAGWDYLSDDIVPVDPHLATALPFPRLLHLRPPTLALLPAVADQLRVVALPCRDSENRPVTLAAPHAQVDQAARPAIAAVVFPRYAPDEPSALVPLTPGVAAVRLAEHSLNSGTLGARAFLWAVQLARRLPCYALTHHSLEQALEHLRSLVAAPG